MTTKPGDEPAFPAFQDDGMAPDQKKQNDPLSIQPIPYQGSKRALAPRICSLFPERVKTLYEPFAVAEAMMAEAGVTVERHSEAKS